MISAIYIPAGPLDQPTFTYSHRQKWDLEAIYEVLNCEVMECIGLGKLQYMYVDELGRQKSLPFNGVASAMYHRLRGGDMIVGNALILAGDQEGDTVSVDPELLFLTAKIAVTLATQQGGFGELA